MADRARRRATGLDRRARAGLLLLVSILIAVAAALGVSSASASRAPGPEPNFATDVVSPRPCAYDSHDPYEKRF